MFVTAESRPVSRPRLWLVLCALTGFLGQLALTAGAMPGEMPRATLERLTGLVVTSATPMAMPGMTDETMASGPSPDMSMPDMAQDGPSHGAVSRPAAKPAAASVASASIVSASDRHASRPGHDPQEACFLCPLLVLAPAIFANAVLPPRRVGAAARIAYRRPEARAPPSARVAAAFPRGPPGSLV